MNSHLKNPFTRSETHSPSPTPSAPSSPASTPDVVEAQVSKKSKEMVQGKTAATVKRLTADLEAEGIEREQARQVLGERIGDGLDTTEATEAVQRAEGRIRALEAALTVATQKDEAARVAREQAERQEKIEKEVEGVAQLKTVLLKWDQLVLDLNRLTVDEMGPALNAARLLLTTSGIRDGELNFLVKVPLEAERHLLQAVHTLIGHGYTPPNMMMYEKLSDVVPDEDFIRSRARPGPTTARVIPTWQGKD